MVVRLLKHQDTLLENPVISQGLSRIMEDDDIRNSSDLLFEEAVKINREYTKLKILKEDYFFRSAASFLSFLVIQSVLLLLLFLFLSRALTAQLRLITRGLKKIEAGSRVYRFPSLKGSEFFRLSGELNQLMDSLSEKERLLREQAKYLGWQEIASFLSHQLKNPLTAIELSGKNLDFLCDEKKMRENTGIILEECERLKDLLKRFNEITSFPDLACKPWAVKELVLEVCRRLPKERADFLTDIPESSMLCCDRGMLEQALQNIFINSIEAAEEQGVAKIRIITEFRTEGRATVLRIRDSLGGFDSALKEKVLLPKFTTKTRGSGLGLPFVQKVITLHRGRLLVDMTEKGGLCFSLYFPEEKN